MAFFGFENPLEDDKAKFYSGGTNEQDVAVYTWGEESYDNLAGALQEEHDELNDETFGDTADVGESQPPLTGCWYLGSSS